MSRRDPDAPLDAFDRDLGRRPADPLGSHAGERHSAAGEKDLVGGLADELGGLGQLAVVDTGAVLHEGGVYIDLDRLGAGEVVAHGGMRAEEGSRWVAKRETDHETWRRLVELGQGLPRREEEGA
jgi:hypothetical protein